MFQLIAGVLGKSPPLKPKEQRENQPLGMSMGVAMVGSLALQWKNNPGKRVEKDLSLYSRKGISLKEGERHTQMSLE